MKPSLPVFSAWTQMVVARKSKCTTEQKDATDYVQVQDEIFGSHEEEWLIIFV